VIFAAEGLEPAWFADQRFDVCVVGTGPAGLSVALRLAKAGRRVALMEAGGIELEDESQEIYDGLSVGADYWPLSASRRRFLGGSSNCWGGWCRPLDAVDFERQKPQPLGGWPIGKRDLDAYAAEADVILDVGDPEPAVVSSFGADQGPFRQIAFRFSRERQLAPRYLDTLRRSARISLFLRANLVDLELDDRLQTVTAAVFRGYDRPQPFKVRAEAYVLCLGGLENPRFLLNANRQITAGIGNQHDLVGRFFTEHPHQMVGTILLAEPMRAREFYAPTHAFMRARETLNFTLYFAPVPELSFASELARSAACNVAFVERLAEAVRGHGLRCYLGGLDDVLAQWSDPEALLAATLAIASEQALNPDSRVRLGAPTDRFGHRRIELDWRYSEIDFHTIRTAAIAFGELLARRDVGRLKLADWLLDGTMAFPGTSEAQVAGPHHLCTTRMSDNPRQGVVDRNCKIHGMANLYLGGSSVFATGGAANPTFTVVQLALRLADHLAVA
jgi:choline dehydrogenase-like flavoprotein